MNKSTHIVSLLPSNVACKFMLEYSTQIGTQSQDRAYILMVESYVAAGHCGKIKDPYYPDFLEGGMSSRY